MVVKLSKPAKPSWYPTPDQMKAAGEWLERGLPKDDTAFLKAQANIDRIMGNSAQPA